MPEVIKIGRDTTLEDLENFEIRLQRENTLATIWLAKDFQTQIFLDTRIAALIAGAKRGRELNVVDWTSTGDFSTSVARFRSSPEGVAAALFATKISAANGVEIPNTKETVIEDIVNYGGRGEPRWTGSWNNLSTKTLTIYAFDMRDPKPLALSKSDDFFSFKRDFEQQRRAYFEHGYGAEYTRRINVGPNEAISRFVFEIFQNAYRHGRRTRTQDLIIPGLRYLRMKRHIGSTSSFPDRSKGFLELQNYLQNKTSKKQQTAFLEVSIIDSGIGIVDRFLSTNPGYRRASEDFEYRCWLMNAIVAKSLSSNAEHSGAGKGLRNALEAVKSVGGFVSIRSGDLWVYYSSQERLDLNQPFRVKSCSEGLGSVRGTQVCMLYPLSEN